MVRPNKKLKVSSRLSPLPEDLLIAILERLNVKSLLRFKCVSKFWFNLIKSPLFVSCHLEKQHKSDDLLFVTRCLPGRKRVVCSFHDLDSSDLEQVGPNMHIDYDERASNFVGSCNGIVGIGYGDFIILCNPVLREYKVLPNCKARVVFDDAFVNTIPNAVTLRWGLLNTSNGIGVVQLQHTYRFPNHNQTQGGDFIEAYLYDFETSLWRKVKHSYKVSTDHLSICDSDSIFFNGACHWLLRDRSTYMIMTLNVSNEVFTVFDCPHWEKDLPDRDEDCHLKVMNNCLAMVRQQKVMFPIPLYQVIEVWVMKEYGLEKSWTKLHGISRAHQISSPILFLKNDMWMLMAEKESQQQERLISRNLITNEIKRYAITGSLGYVQALFYNKSLITL